ncbi:hypothetical protein, partial [uncultured Selenomonas sp.]|uniref:hypothetical protein n=1 Tax=uncultured Selenomonas sp. TaxID=159275 RepID=UPI0028DAFB05
RQTHQGLKFPTENILTHTAPGKTLAIFVRCCIMGNGFERTMIALSLLFRGNPAATRILGTVAIPLEGFS